jgi:peptidoglycan/LPS O-acetylase OafA/YrhL
MGRLPGIHGLRAIAAVGVVFFHVAYIVPSTVLPPVFSTIIPTLVLSVPLFFVISAFSLAYAHAHSIDQKGWIGPYLIKRFFRIAPLFYAMIFAYWACSYWLFDLRTALIDMTFLYNFFPGEHASIVGAGWSIGVEMPFYLAFPIILQRVRSLSASLILVILTTVISTFSRFWLSDLPNGYAHMALVSNISMFATGLIAYYCFASWTERRSRLLPFVGIASVAWLVALFSFRGNFAGMFDAPTWALGFGLLCVWQAARPSRLLSSASMQWLGERSFSIYLLHPIVIFALVRNGLYTPIFDATRPIIGAWSYLPCVGLTLAIVLPASAVTYRIIERPGQKLGSMLIKRLRERSDHEATAAVTV